MWSICLALTFVFKVVAPSIDNISIPNMHSIYSFLSLNHTLPFFLDSVYGRSAVSNNIVITSEPMSLSSSVSKCFRMQLMNASCQIRIMPIMKTLCEP